MNQLKTIVIATNNDHKLKEMSEILSPLGFECVTLKDVGFFEDIEETGNTLTENSLIKCRAVFEKINKPVVADDTGLFVDVLDFAPGVHTARYAGEQCDPQKNVDKLLKELSGIPIEQRNARFVSVISYIDGDGKHKTFSGVCEGRIGFEKRGEGGFGYDPIFLTTGNRTLAEIGDKHKHDISHRARALRKFCFYLRNIKRMRKENDI